MPKEAAEYYSQRATSGGLMICEATGDNRLIARFTGKLQGCDTSPAFQQFYHSLLWPCSD